jgi:hypothetical protein
MLSGGQPVEFVASSYGNLMTLGIGSHGWYRYEFKRPSCKLPNAANPVSEH